MLNREQREHFKADTGFSSDDEVGERFQVLADVAPAILWVTDADNRCTFLSRSWYEVTGQSNGGGLGFGWLDAVHPADRDETSRRFLEAARVPEFFSLDFRQRQRDGSYRWVVDQGRPRFGDDGRWQGYVGSVVDVHDRMVAIESVRQSEARQRFLLQLNDRLRALEDPAEIQYQAARALCQRLGASRVGYAEDQQDGEMVVVTRNYTNGVPGIEGRYRYADYSGELLRELSAGRTLACYDIAADSTLTAAQQEAHARLQLGATVNVPLVKGGRLVAVLFVHSREARHWSRDELALVESVAARTWDAVERARAEAALRDSEARYRTLFTSIDEGFCILEVIFDRGGQPVDFRYVETNPAFERQTGMSQALGRTIREIVPDIEPIWFELYGEVVRTGTAMRFVDHAESMGRWFDVFAFRIGDPSLCQVAVLFNDITERKRSEEEREALLAAERRIRAEAEAANRAKADFLASMSHELRTPLNAIGGYVELLDLGIHGPLTDAQRQALTRVTANQRHLLTLINDVLAFAKLEAGQVEFDLAALEVRDLLASVEPLVGPLAQLKGLALSVHECDPALHLVGDRERVRQILLNLVSNAIKFTPEGGWVRLRCVPDGEWIELQVCDNGPGIAADKQRRIFDPFVQVDRRLSRPQEGVGLGLAISRDLARAMQCELSVESVPDTGSTFTLRLPRG
jgi:PAS domain S-box-containing protein